MKIKNILLGVLLTASFPVFSQTYSVYKVSTAPTIDGNLSDWNTAFSSPFVVHNTGASATQSTTVSFAWDSQNLYVAYNVIDSKVVGSSQSHDASIFNTDDLVELFLDADGDTKNYVELGANAYSTNYDIILKCVQSTCGGWNDDISWNISGLQTVALKNVSGFTVEMKIPFASLNTVPNGGFSNPSIGTTWKGNAFRIDYGGNATEYLAISAYSGGNFGFHQPSLFKTFKFVDQITGIASALPENTYSISPNPTENQFEINGGEIGHIELFNLSGEIQPISRVGNIVNIQQLQNGIYVAKIEIGSSVFYQKIIKK